MSKHDTPEQTCHRRTLQHTKRLARITKDPRTFLLVYGVLVSLLLSGVYLYKPDLLHIIEYKIYDIMVRSLPASQEEGIPVIVDLDEESLADFGQWPWPRYRVALLLEKLKQAGVLSVGLDIIFSEPDRTSLGVLQQEILRELDIQFTFAGLPKDFYDNDRILANALLDTPFVLGYKFLFNQKKTRPSDCQLHPLDAIVRQGKQQNVDFTRLFYASDVLCSLPEFSKAVPASGFLNYTADKDGTIRRTPLFIHYNGHLYPSLALATLMQALHAQQVMLKMTSNGVESLSVKKHRIPLDSQGNLLIRYRGPQQGFDYFSARDILQDRIPHEKLQGKIVFLGASALGLEDTHPTPFSIRFPGVEVHATIVDNILKGEFLSRPYWIRGGEFLLILSLGILSSWLLIRTSALKSVLVLTMIATGLWYGSYWILLKYGMSVSPVMPILTLFSTFSVLTSSKFWFEEQKVKEQTKELLRIQDLTIFSLLSLVETRDNETGEHIIRTQHYVRTLAEQLATHPRFRDFLNRTNIEYLYKSASLHDIGKVGVPDSVLKKAGKFTPEDFEIMKKHTIYGREALARAEQALDDGKDSLFLCCAQELTYTHHERWDGSGYPQGLKENEIPISGRLMALADVYDALISKRVYKPAFSHEEAKAIIVRDKGKHFDPDVVDAFLKTENIFKKIAAEFSDSSSECPS